MSDKRIKTAALLRFLAEDQRLSDAASKLDLPLDSAREVLERIADQYAPATSLLESKAESAVAYTDGGARGNPGPAGCGVVILDPEGKTIFSTSRFLGEATNNVAEYNGLIIAIESALDLGIENLEVRSDSKLLVEQMKGHYKVKSRNLIPLVTKAQKLARQLKNVVYTHVRREKNREADRLANEAMDAGA